MSGNHHTLRVQKHGAEGISTELTRFNRTNSLQSCHLLGRLHSIGELVSSTTLSRYRVDQSGLKLGLTIDARLVRRLLAVQVRQAHWCTVHSELTSYGILLCVEALVLALLRTRSQRRSLHQTRALV